MKPNCSRLHQLSTCAREQADSVLHQPKMYVHAVAWQVLMASLNCSAIRQIVLAHSAVGAAVQAYSCSSPQKSQSPILWLDEIHFAPPFRNPGMMIPLYIPNNGFPWFQSGAGFCSSTVVRGSVQAGLRKFRHLLASWRLIASNPTKTIQEISGSQMHAHTHGS